MMHTEFDITEGKILFLEGNNCKRGIKFAQAELKNPLRLLTTTVGIDSKKVRRLAVRSDVPVPKDKVAGMIRIARQKKVEAPVKMGQIIVADILKTGASIIASSTVEE